MSELLFLEPVFIDKIWGGTKLKDVFNYDINGENIGECWAISGHKNGESVVKNGSHKGKKVSEIYKTTTDIFGKPEFDEFPLLIKILDAKADLSIQVHPDDEYGLRVEKEFGKAECWYVLDCNEDTDIVMGHNAKNKEEVKEMITNKKWNDFLTIKDLNKDEFYYISPGMVHAIRSNTLIYELQQSSDTTYRLYDYNRLSDGKLRELHIDKSIDVITAPQNVELTTPKKISDTESLMIENKYFKLRKIENKSKHTYNNDGKYLLCTVIEGNGKFNDTNIKLGDNFIVPIGLSTFSVEGNVKIMVASE